MKQNNQYYIKLDRLKPIISLTLVTFCTVQLII